MKIGLGLYPHLLNAENYRFAYQAGVTHIVAHLPGFARREGRGCRKKRCGPWRNSPGSSEK